MTFTLQAKTEAGYSPGIPFNTFHGAKENADWHYRNYGTHTRVLNEAGTVLYIPNELNPML
jgi:hypothetical protein